jgi:glycosyltransferase domain-containing protein
MSSAESLTLIVQVKDQAHLVERWLAWATDQAMRLPVLIADGSHGPEPRRLVQDARFRNLRLSYFSRGPDFNRGEFYQKTVAALESCSTPFCSLLADDDLPNFASLVELSRALEDPETVCVRGWVHNFSLVSEAMGELRPAIQVLPHDPSLASPDLRTRLQGHFFRYNLNFHDIFRTKDLLAIKRKLLQSQIMDPFLGELLTSVLAVIQGKVERQLLPFLYRASRRASNDQRYLREYDNWDRVFQGDWMREYHQCLNLWSEASEGRADKAFLHRLFRAYYAPSIMDCLRRDIVQEVAKKDGPPMAEFGSPRAPVWAKVLLEALRPFEKTAQKLRKFKKRAASRLLDSPGKTPVEASHKQVLEFLTRYHSGMSDLEMQKFL